MISLRQHAISLAAVFVALAIGIVLGSGLLSSGLVSGLRDDKTGLENQVDDLRTRLTNVIPAGVQLRTGAVDQGSLAGDLLGSVLLLNAQTAQPQSTPEELSLALETLRSGGFIAYDNGAVAPAQLAVVVTGSGASDVEDGNRGAIVARFAGALDSRGAGAVLAGRSGAAEGNGSIAVVRADSALSSALSTVDNVDREAGRITTVLALAEQLDGASGRYGTGANANAVTVGAPVS